MSKYNKYCLCVYNEYKELILKKCMSCKGCSKKRMPRDKPACVRANGASGRVLVYNEEFKQLFDYHKRREI